MWWGEYDLLEDVHSYIQWLDPVPLHPWVLVNTVLIMYVVQWWKTFIWSPADFVRLPTDKEMISL